jgi:hypothetical protein
VKNMNIKIHRNIILPFVFYECEAEGGEDGEGGEGGEGGEDGEEEWRITAK